MSRHGYADDLDYQYLNLYRGTVKRCINSKAGQSFLRELADAMDAMPEKVLIADELINSDGDCCTIGVVCKSRAIDVNAIDYEDPEQVGSAVGIARQMAAEIEYENDDGAWHDESPGQRWQRMRKWVAEHIREQADV